MKRVLMFALALVIVSASLTNAQDFSNLIVDVPSGWIATESDNGGTVLLQDSSDSSVFIMFVIRETEGRSLYDNAYSWYEADDTSNFESDSHGGYSFLWTDSDGVISDVFVDDNSTNPNIESGYYWVATVSEYVDDATWDSVYASAYSPGSAGGDEESSGCNSGFGVLTLCVLGLVLKKR